MTSNVTTTSFLFRGAYVGRAIGQKRQPMRPLFLGEADDEALTRRPRRNEANRLGYARALRVSFAVERKDAPELTSDDNQFDLVLIFEVFEHLLDFKKPYSESRGVLWTKGLWYSQFRLLKGQKTIACKAS